MNTIEKIKNNKTLMILLALILCVLLVIIARITYAYFATQIGDPASVQIRTTADTVDEFKFVEGNQLSLQATPATLPENGSNLVSTSSPKVTLLANSTTNSATRNYYVYFNITSNDFQYTNGTNPEILLSITSPNGVITSLNGLTYHTINGVSGFDVTTYQGLITIASGFQITSNSSTTKTTQNWTFTLTYLNRDYDQSANFNHTMNTKTIFSKDDRAYTVTFDANGGVVNLANKSVISGSTYGALPEPTKSGYLFDGWYSNKITDLTMTSGTSQYKYTAIAKVVPGTTYNVNIGSASVTSGSATQFTAYIYDSTGVTGANSKLINFGNNINFNITCPASMDPTHNINILIYSGKSGSTSGINTQYNDIKVSTNDNASNYLGSSLVKMSGNHTLYAHWTN